MVKGKKEEQGYQLQVEFSEDADIVTIKEEIDKEVEERLPDLVKTWIAQGKTDSPMVEGNRLIKKREVVKNWIESGKIKVDDSEESH